LACALGLLASAPAEGEEKPLAPVEGSN